MPAAKRPFDAADPPKTTCHRWDNLNENRMITVVVRIRSTPIVSATGIYQKPKISCAGGGGTWISAPEDTIRPSRTQVPVFAGAKALMKPVKAIPAPKA